MERDARDLRLSPDPEALKQDRDRREALAQQYHFCFTQYPEVLRDIEHLGGVGTTLLATDASGHFDRDLTLVRLGGYELVNLIRGMVTAGRLGSEEQTGHGEVQRSAE
jgi:hypothetical protein